MVYFFILQYKLIYHHLKKIESVQPTTYTKKPLKVSL